MISMPKPLLSEKILADLYRQTVEETNEFKNIEPEIVQKDPKKLLILRLALGMSQNKFEKHVGNKSKNISKYETGKIKNLQYKTAQRICDRLKASLKSASFENVLDEFRRSQKDSMGWFKTHSESQKVVEGRQRGAAESLKLRATPQETQLSSELTKLNIQHILNFPLSRNTIVDLFLPSEKIVIECKEIKSNSRREIKEQIRNLAYQGYKIRFNFSDKRVWALISIPRKLNSYDLAELQGPFEKVFSDVNGISKSFSR